MHGIRLGMNVSIKKSNEISVKVINRETVELQEFKMSYQSFMQRLIGHRKNIKDEKFIVDSVNFGTFHINSI